MSISHAFHSGPPQLPAKIGPPITYPLAISVDNAMGINLNFKTTMRV